MNNFSKILISAGMVFILIGIGAFILERFNIPLGRLPGDIIVRKDKFSFYLPITTCILVSIVVSIIFYLFRK